MFTRIKKIKNIPYAYLVESSWDNGKARQKVVKYLGKVHTLQKQKDISFDEFCEQEKQQVTENTSYENTILLLITWTLSQHDFTKDPLLKEKWIWKEGTLTFDPKELSIKSAKKDATAKINEGFMSTYSIKQLLSIELNKRLMEQRQAATMLAKAFVSVGIEIPSDIFIMVFEKVYKE